MAQTAAPASSRHIKIVILDLNGNHVGGADVRFEIGGVPVGFIKNCEGYASVEVSNNRATIDVEVSSGGSVQRVRLLPGDDEHTFTFNRMTLNESVSPPVAKCPDGTSGQPCVICRIGEIQVRICV